MLEIQLKELTNAINSLTAALLKDRTAQPHEAEEAVVDEPAQKPSKPAAKKQTKKKAEEQPTVTADEVKAKLGELAALVGGTGPKSILTKHGIAKFSDIEDEQLAPVYADAIAAIAEAQEG